VSGSGINWAICKSAPHSRQITTPAPHHSAFYSIKKLHNNSTVIEKQQTKEDSRKMQPAAKEVKPFMMLWACEG